MDVIRLVKQKSLLCFCPVTGCCVSFDWRDLRYASPRSARNLRKSCYARRYTLCGLRRADRKGRYSNARFSHNRLTFVRNSRISCFPKGNFLETRASRRSDKSNELESRRPTVVKISKAKRSVLNFVGCVSRPNEKALKNCTPFFSFRQKTTCCHVTGDASI